jgi:hypothetical protein
VTTLTASRLVARPLTALKLMAMRVGEALGTFSPASLFSDGEEGALFDLSDTRLLFQDVNGTEPVVDVGDPIGLALDTSKGLRATGPALGPELVTNGTFDDGTTGWSAVSDAILSSANNQITVEVAPGDSFCAATQMITLVPGERYLYEFIKVSQDSNSVWGISSTGPSSVRDVIQFPTGDTGRKSGHFTATVSTAWLQLGANSAPGDQTIYERVSVRRVIPISERFSGLGDEEVANGDFSGGTTGWVAGSGATLSASDGEITIESNDAFSNAHQKLTLEAGATYFYSITKVSQDADSGWGFAETTTGSRFLALGAATVGTFSGVFVAPASAVYVQLNSQGAAGNEAIYSNVVVRPLPGNHATQPTSTARPLYGRYPAGGRRNELNATASLATQNVTVTATQRTLSFKGTGTVTLSGTSTAGPLVGTGADDRVTLTFTPTAGALTLTVSGSVTDAQLELGSTATPYQRVAADYDITEAGVADKYGLLFDGVDDRLVTNAIDMTGTDAASIAAAVMFSPVQGTAARIVSQQTDTGGRLQLSTSATLNAFMAAGGSTTRFANRTLTPGPYSPFALLGRVDISEDDLRLFEGETKSDDMGTGDFTNHEFAIGGQDSGAANTMAGFINAAMLIDRYITDEEATALAGYLEGKAGV